MTYPAVVSFLVLVMVSAMLLVIPMFQNIFAEPVARFRLPR